jgi:hypothetical protein
LNVVPAFGCADDLVADVGVDLLGELAVAESEGQNVARDVVMQFRRGRAFEVTVLDSEAADDGITEVGAAFLRTLRMRSFSRSSLSLPSK